MQEYNTMVNRSTSRKKVQYPLPSTMMGTAYPTLNYNSSNASSHLVFMPQNSQTASYSMNTTPMTKQV